jgi:arylformamidase
MIQVTSRAPSRRAVLGGLGAGAFIAAGGTPTFAQTPPSSTSKVFLDYTQDDLDRAYDQRVWAPNGGEIIKRYATDGAAVRARLTFTTRAFGPSDDETLDIFPVSRPDAPIHVHLHGGAWRALTKEDASFLAPSSVHRGIIYVAVNFATIPKVRLPEMIDQARRAIVWVYRNAREFGGDPDRIHVSGHSSGAHMAGVLMTSDWSPLGLPRDVIKSGLLVSGLYDLEPVMMSARSSYVKLSAAEARALSPMLHLEWLVSPVTAVYGSGESPEFKRQSQAFIAAAATMGKTASLYPVEGVNHFEAPYLLLDGSRLPTRVGFAAMESS